MFFILSSKLVSCYIHACFYFQTKQNSNWSCSACTLENVILRVKCECCGTGRTEEKFKSPATDGSILLRPCIVCLFAEAEYVFINCGHLCVCKDCVSNFSRLPGAGSTSSRLDERWEHKCPKCRVTIEQNPIRVFYE